MKYYKITLNNPNKQGISEITITEDMLNQLAPILNDKKIIKMGDGFINTAYIVIIEPDIETNRLEESIQPKIAEKTVSTTHKENLEKMSDLREKLQDQGVI